MYKQKLQNLVEWARENINARSPHAFNLNFIVKVNKSVCVCVGVWVGVNVLE